MLLWYKVQKINKVIISLSIHSIHLASVFSFIYSNEPKHYNQVLQFDIKIAFAEQP